MRRRRLAQALTLALLASLAGVFVYRQRAASHSEDASLEPVIWRMVEAARARDPAGYLDCFTGELQARLEKNLQEMGPARFRESLAAMLGPVKGIAVSAAQMSSGSEGRVSVEYVYADGNEVQQVYLRRARGAWKIYRLDGAERARALIPYGTAVTE